MQRTANMLAALMFALIIAQPAFAKGPRGPQDGTCSQPTVVLPALDAAEEAFLVQLRQEEKLARDVYLTLNEKWGLRIFANIAVSEQRHMNAVGNLLTRYGIADPITDNTAGVYADDEFVELYHDLVEAGNESLVAALTVGATIEDLDIADLENAISETSNPDLILVYGKLLAGSENHLRAFVAWLAQWNATYVPQFISQERFEEIIGATAARGR